MFRLLKDLEGALAIQRVLHADWEAAGEKDGYVYEELGECLLALGRAEEAAPWFAKAWLELSKDEWTRSEEPARLERLKKLGGA